MDITTEELKKLGSYLKGRLATFIADRNLLEIQWLKNLRQYRGQYDPSVLNNIDPARSRVYPRDTRIKVKGGVAKMMEMMFPSQEKNWELQVAPNPSIPEEDLQNIVDNLQASGAPITSEAIEKAVVNFAKDRMREMEEEIESQLDDPGIDYPQLCKRVVRGGYLYGFGVAKSPIVRTLQERFWELDKETNKYKAVSKRLRRPYPEHVRSWDFYPDLSAKEWIDQDMVFERIVFSKHDFSSLADNSVFLSAAVKQYVQDHPEGNYVAKTYEAELQRLARTTNIADRSTRRYEAYRALGFISASTLQAVGIEVKDSELSDDIFADVWFIDDVVIRADRSAFGERPSDQYHAFIYTEDEDSGLLGIGLPEEVNDSQMSICASTRALMDNMAAVAGPIFEVNTTLLAKGRKSIGPIHAFMTIEREGDGVEAQYPAVRDIKTESHVPEILSIIAMQRQQLDVESNLPAYSMGGSQQLSGEAFRTSSNMSMMMGSANMMTKDTVRAFDKFTSSLIGSLLKWNQEFNEKIELRGAYNVVAKGNLSLVAKEVRGAALDQFVSTLTPEERAILDTYGLLIDRLRARDLPTDRVIPEEEAKKVIQDMRAAQSQASQVEQGLTQAKTQNAAADAQKKQVEAQKISSTVEATIQEIMSRVTQNIANAKSSKDKNQLENLKTLLSTATEKTPTGQVQ